MNTRVSLGTWRTKSSIAWGLSKTPVGLLGLQIQTNRVASLITARAPAKSKWPVAGLTGTSLTAAPSTVACSAYSEKAGLATTT